MSASEKLRALEGAARPYWDEDSMAQEHVIAANRCVDALVDALPQIVAVVEAAENAVTVAWTDKATDEQNEILRQRADAIPAALSALEEALS